MHRNRHLAILILVHNNENQVNRLINHISKDFDVYVHIDKKSSVKIVKNENVYIFKKYKVYWGSINLTLSALFLLKKAFLKGYKRYILISGLDLPIIKNEEIKKYFDNNNKEYVSFTKVTTSESDGWACMDRLTKYHIMNYNKENCFFIKRIIIRIVRNILHFYSKIKPRKIDYDFYGGSNWINITHACAKKIFEYLEANKKYISRFKWTSCSDEIFFQTILKNTEGINIENNCLRYVDWQAGTLHEGTPKILRLEDYEKLILSGHLFARKFDEKTDNKIIELIYKKIE